MLRAGMMKEGIAHHLPTTIPAKRNLSIGYWWAAGKLPTSLCLPVNAG